MTYVHDHPHCSGCASILPLLARTVAPVAFSAIGPGVVAGASRAPAAVTNADVRPATTVYVAKKVVTMEAGPPATAVAVRGSTIVAAGPLDAVVAELPAGSFSVDRRFADSVIVPGLIEQHIHPLLGALSMACAVIAIEDWDVPGRFSKAASGNADYTARLKAALEGMRDAPPGETLFTWGYHHYFHGLIRRSQLDALDAERPIVIWHRSCHELILNSAALRKYGITEASLAGHGMASTQARFDEGHFFEKGLELVVAPVGKDMLSPERIGTGVDLFRSYVRSKGITTICEPGTQLSRQIQDFWEASLGGDVGFRTYFIADGRALSEKYKNDIDGLIPATQAFTSWGRGNVAWLPNQVKLFSDGAIFSLLMQVEEPYLDGHKGEWIAEPAAYAAAFKKYWDAGYHIHTHVNGDAGLQLVADTLAENMRSNPRTDHRFTVVHFAVSKDEQVVRLAELGAIVSGNPYYVSALADSYSELGLGPERATSMVRLGTAVRNGISVSLHSDMPMAPADPMFLVWCAVNRTTASGKTAGPDQRLSAEQALRAVTLDAAYSIGLENEIGSIKAGKKADLTVLDVDPLAIEPSKIRDIRVVATVFDGRLVGAGEASPGATKEAAQLHASDAPLQRDALSSAAG